MMLSTCVQAGQRREIARWLKGNDVEGVEWYVDKESGDTLDRPEFKRLQQSVFMGEVDAVIVYKLDRLSRSVQNGLAVLYDWCDKGLRIVSVTQQIDFNGTVGKIIAAVLFGVAEMEQETRRERQAAGIAVAKQEGKYKGRKRGTTKAKPPSHPTAGQGKVRGACRRQRQGRRQAECSASRL
jgi:DNA invertase Pin-like site-specific DNA recombinase